jgi:hypothetical protein
VIICKHKIIKEMIYMSLVEKDWEYKGLRCQVIMTNMGHRCGYVGVNKNHPLFGVEYDESCEYLAQRKNVDDLELGKKSVMAIFSYDDETVSPIIAFDVHGGLTYSGGFDDDERWYFGYDCAHYGDAKDLSVVPDSVRELELKFPTGGVLRTLEYCVDECESLAQQLVDIVDKLN